MPLLIGKESCPSNSTTSPNGANPALVRGCTASLSGIYLTEDPDPAEATVRENINPDMTDHTDILYCFTEFMHLVHRHFLRRQQFLPELALGYYRISRARSHHGCL